MTHPPSAAGTRNHFDSDLARRDAAAARQRPARPAGGAGRAGPGHPRASSAVPIGRAHERPPRVVIADHHPASRVGLRLTLEGAGFHVVAEAGTGEQAAALAAALRPDACLLAIDIRGGGIVAARAISTRAPGTAVVMLTGRVDGDDLVDAVIAGGVRGRAQDHRPGAAAGGHPEGDRGRGRDPARARSAGARGAPAAWQLRGGAGRA